MEIEGFRRETRWYTRDGHFYVATRTKGQTTYMRCASDRCPARWSIKNGDLSAIAGSHDHEPTPWVTNRNAMYNALKRRATNSNLTCHQIYEEEAARYPDAAPHLLFETVAPSMRKWRRSVQPQIPRTLQDYAAALAEHPHYSYILLATVSAGGATAVILVMRGFVQCLRDSSTIIADGTFLTVPAGLPAYQILTIHSVVEQAFFHPILVLMQNRQQSLYEAVLQRVWQAAGNPRPTNVVTDFEPALQAALTAVTGVQTQGCLFHFVQALLKRARREGILVRRNSPGWKLVQLYATLALLPPNQVVLGLAEMRGIADQEGLPFNDNYHSYFESQWMGRVGPHNFSVHGRPHQTSNVAESFHAALRRSLGASPNIWRFTEVAAQKFNVSESRIEAQRRGILRRRNRNRQYVRQNILAANERALAQGIVTLREFLVASSRQMEVGVDVPDIGAEIEVNDEPIIPEHQPQREPENNEPIQEHQPENNELIPENHQPRNNEPIAQHRALALSCNICTENVLPAVALIPCGHILCAQCQDRLDGTCPFCRVIVNNTLRLFVN